MGNRKGDLCNFVYPSKCLYPETIALQIATFLLKGVIVYGVILFVIQ